MSDGDLIGSVLAYCAVITAFIQTLGFLHAFYFQTEKFFDALGGLNSLLYIPTAWWVLQADKDLPPERGLFDGGPKTVFSLLFGLSRGWLLLFLAWRAGERKGDGRFDAWKGDFAKFGAVWLLQAVWCLLIALPFIVVAGDATSEPQMSALAWLFAGMFLFGLVLEIAADVQKARWVKEGRKGGFCRVGLWRYSRHPNYFGEMLMWFSAWLLVVNSILLENGKKPSAIWIGVAALSPIFTKCVLLFGSGLPLAEGKHLKRYYKSDFGEKYAKYREETSILVPMPNAAWRALPTALKSTLLGEWKRYEYSEESEETFTAKEEGYGGLASGEEVQFS